MAPAPPFLLLSPMIATTEYKPICVIMYGNYAPLVHASCSLQTSVALIYRPWPD
ncbi:hypothetical protein BO70DRAFT_155209 [Aspergillus heteromorphus CBS 117.55]|uniref:Uncharacterized protein n=1 Tax=Aspergillus heteromorphus CBS 117.55 TaxID=1448321 RepID=A0A317V7F2_9EURO|nr:uncharacterized protein BO70DRAFT_155209 [Aspergillus heteromorphus CBS 117.55]PWY68060.1 hypothetical protein BO70DRAFT_155209 [Aspergillus heteromorphus CBS 117.55]